MTVWLALSDPVDAAHGCMQFRRCSHSRGQLPHVDDASDTSNMLSRGQRVEAEEEEGDAVMVMAELRGGQASLHHFHLVHESGSNNGTSTRVGLAMRYGKR